MSKAVVFGSFVVDLMARTPHLPIPGETVKGFMFKKGAGGKGFNQCVAAHKAGADVAMITKLGRDSFAEEALNVMRDLGMTQEHLFFSKDTETGIALILVDDQSSQNEIVIVPGACDTITREETLSIESLVKDAEYVLMQLEVNQDANELAAEIAWKNGCKVIVNTAPAPQTAVSDDFLSKAFMVTPNEVEAEAITGIHVKDRDSAKRAAGYFHSKGVENVLITLGEKGVFVSAEGCSEIIPAYRVNALDTTGAGDAFNGGLLAALSKGESICEAVRFANALAAISVQRLGTTPSMPWLEEIESFLASQKEAAFI